MSDAPSHGSGVGDATGRGAFEAVIGLEIHAQLATATKIFCSCPTGAAAAANVAVCPVCLGLPGALPVLNASVVDMAVRSALAFECSVHEWSLFARKHYFYPDLPKGYQITQYDRPLATGGRLESDMAGPPYDVRITRVHVEEDAGRSVHAPGGDGSATGIDFNRSGVPLIEIVTGPDLRSPADASATFRRIREVLVAIGVNDGNLEQGSLRCDANVSVRRRGERGLGTRTEIKNLNSFRFLQKALEYEIGRQVGLAAAGDSIIAETRLWDVGASVTVPMRDKEEADDYRYFPEPDLPPLRITADRVARLRAELPELPAAARRRLVREHHVAEPDAVLFTQTYAGLDTYVLAVATACGQMSDAVNWVRGEVVRALKDEGIDDASGFATRVPPVHLAALIRMVATGAINRPTSRAVFQRMVETGEAPGSIVEAGGLAQVDDQQALLEIVREVLAKNPGIVAQYRSGKTKVFAFFVGQVLKSTGGRASTPVVNDLLRRELDGAA